MTLCIIITILGIALSIVEANAWFIVPKICIYACFGIAGILLIANIVNRFIIVQRASKITKGRW